MRTLARTFAAAAAYLVGIAVVYRFVTEEHAGILLLLGSAATLALVAVYTVRRGGHRSPPAPEDDPEAEPTSFAGTPVGSFPFSSAWPLVLVGGLVVAVFGVLYTVILLPIGVVLSGVAVLGLMRESRA